MQKLSTIFQKLTEKNQKPQNFGNWHQVKTQKSAQKTSLSTYSFRSAADTAAGTMIQ